MLKTYFLDVKAGERLLNRFEEHFALDHEATQHSKELAGSLRRRHFNNQPGLTIVVLDQAGRKIHTEIVYPASEHR